MHEPDRLRDCFIQDPFTTSGRSKKSCAKFSAPPPSEWEGGLSRLAVLLIWGLPLLFGGCYERVVYDTFDGYRQMSMADGPSPGSPTRPDGTADPRLTRDRDWSILIETFTGEKARPEAANLMQRLRYEKAIPDLWVKPVGEQFHLMRGRYASRDAPPALRDLEQTRMVPLDGERRFGSIELARLSTMAANSDSLDARMHQDRGPYSLQVAVFELGSPKTSRHAAEGKAAELRKAGHEAFYYHGESRSMVTVGLFSDKDRVPVKTTLPSGKEVFQYAYGPRIKTLQEEFPHNLVNGQLHHEQMPDGTKRPQASSLIQIK